VSTSPLSPRQLEILRLGSEGLTADQTAAKLHLGVDTVKTYRRRILATLGAVNTTQAVAIAYDRGLFYAPLLRICPGCGWTPGEGHNQQRRQP
jgi:DNA-binding CsgD family transcriptional regulator